jgi:hypothetical protein
MDWILIAIPFIAGCLFPFLLDWIVGRVYVWRVRRRNRGWEQRQIESAKAILKAMEHWDKGEDAPGRELYGGYADKDQDAL